MMQFTIKMPTQPLTIVAVGDLPIYLLTIAAVGAVSNEAACDEVVHAAVVDSGSQS